MGFSADWLELREPSDHAARDVSLLKRAVSAAGEHPIILDLGCGTGSTVRAFEAVLPQNAQWRLVDNDSKLLQLAGEAAGENATVHQQNLLDIDSLPLEGVTLVTASALIDLVSRKWLEKLAARVSVPVYLALSYDGQMSWKPEHPMDEAVTVAFNSHQNTDKGFGPALGPDSVEVARKIFTAHGFDVQTAPSPWQLSSKEVKLQQELVAGIAQGAIEFGLQGAGLWASERIALAGETTCQIGHGDLLAIPRSKSERA